MPSVVAIVEEPVRSVVEYSPTEPPTTNAPGMTDQSPDRTPISMARMGWNEGSVSD